MGLGFNRWNLGEDGVNIDHFAAFGALAQLASASRAGSFSARALLTG
jgi:hypothetical protein